MKIKNHLKQPRQFNVEELIEFAVKTLNISNDIEISLMYNEKLLDKLSKDVEFSALLCNPIPNHYVLYTREGIALQHILCHELIHLHQYDRGDLKANQDFTEMVWKGENFDNSISYDKREWEIEAFSKQQKLWRMFKKYKRQQKKNEKSAN